MKLARNSFFYQRFPFHDAVTHSARDMWRTGRDPVTTVFARSDLRATDPRCPVNSSRARTAHRFPVRAAACFTFRGARNDHGITFWKSGPRLAAFVNTQIARTRERQTPLPAYLNRSPARENFRYKPRLVRSPENVHPIPRKTPSFRLWTITRVHNSYFKTFFAFSRRGSMCITINLYWFNSPTGPILLLNITMLTYWLQRAWNKMAHSFFFNNTVEKVKSR